MNKKYYESVDILKVILMAIVILSGYIIPGNFGAYLSPITCFSGCGFFFLYGYFVLFKIEEDDSHLKRSIKRLFITFAVCSVIYFALYYIEMRLSGGDPFALFTTRSIFNFFVLNIWSPTIGFNVFFLQSALYAAIICYFANKLKLMKYDTQVMIVLFLLATIFGEGAGLINFKAFGYTYISGNFLTRALPYMLLGRLIHKYRTDRFFYTLKTWVWVLVFVVGVMLSFLEIVGLAVYDKLVYLNHLVGFIPMTVAVCMIALRYDRSFRIGKYSRDTYIAMFYSYTVISELVYLVVWTWFPSVSGIVAYIGFVSMGLTLIISGLYSYLKNRNKTDTIRKERRIKNEA